MGICCQKGYGFVTLESSTRYGKSLLSITGYPSGADERGVNLHGMRSACVVGSLFITEKAHLLQLKETKNL